MGPMWDYNASMGNTPYNFCAANDTIGWQYQSQRLCRVDRKQPFWWKRLLDDPAYVSQLQARWTTLRSGVLNLSNILAMIQQNRDMVSEAQPRDYERWNVVGDHGNFEEEMDFLEDWLDKRLKWMDRNVPLLGNFIRRPDTVVPITCEQAVSLSTYTGKQLTYQWSLERNTFAWRYGEQHFGYPTRHLLSGSHPGGELLYRNANHSCAQPGSE